MSRRIFIHVGFPKTGSTFLQKLFFPGHPDLEYLGKQTPVQVEGNSLWDRLRASLFVQSEYVNEDSKTPSAIADVIGDIEEKQSPEWLQRIYKLPDTYWNAEREKEYIDGLLDSDSGTVFCASDEGMIGSAVWFPYRFERSAVRLHELFPEGEILITLRNQYSMLTSVYKQYVSNGGTRPLKKMLNFEKQWFSEAAPTVYLRHLFYHEKIKNAQRLWGEENVHVKLFEEFRSDQEAFLTELCEALQISKYIPDHLDKRINRGAKINVFFHLKRRLNSLMRTRTQPENVLPPFPTGLLTLSQEFATENHWSGPKEKFKSIFGRRLADRLESFYAESNRETGRLLDRELLDDYPM